MHGFVCCVDSCFKAAYRPTIPKRSVVKISSEENTSISQEKASEKLTPGERFLELVADITVYLLSAAILVGAVFFAFNASPTKSIFGFRYYTILTPSMSPTYNVGDVIIVKIAGPESINVDDVITFNPSSDGGAYLTHRVFEKYEDYEGTGVTCFRTKGDANDSEDSFLIEADRVIGKVKFSIPKLGYIVRFVQMRWYFVAAIVVMLIVFIHLLRMYIDLGSEESDNAEAGAVSGSAEKKLPT